MLPVFSIGAQIQSSYFAKSAAMTEASNSAIDKDNSTLQRGVTADALVQTSVKGQSSRGNAVDVVV